VRAESPEELAGELRRAAMPHLEAVAGQAWVQADKHVRGAVRGVLTDSFPDLKPDRIEALIDRNVSITDRRVIVRFDDLAAQILSGT